MFPFDDVIMDPVNLPYPLNQRLFRHKDEINGWIFHLKKKPSAHGSLKHTHVWQHDQPCHSMLYPHGAGSNKM